MRPAGDAVELWAWLRADLETLTGVARSGAFVTVVLGRSGLGKTTLLNRLRATLADDSAMRFAVMDAARGAADSGTPSTQPDTEEVMGHLRKLADSGLSPILAVDNAHCLDDEELEAILKLATPAGSGASTALSLMLFGELSLQPMFSRVATAALRNRTFCLRLQPLNPEQCRTYVMDRFAAAGTAPPDEEELGRICRQSEGVPGKILELIRPQLATGHGHCAERAIGPTKSAYGGLLVLVAVGLAAAIGGYHWLAAPGTTVAQQTEALETAISSSPERPSLAATPSPEESNEQPSAAAASPPQDFPATARGEPVASMRMLDMKFLATASKETYMLQVMAGRDLERLTGLALEAGFKDPAYVRFRREGEYWFSVLLGPFDDLEAAQRAWRELTPVQKRFGPVIRSLASFSERPAADRES